MNDSPRYTERGFKAIVDQEGLGYTLVHYLDPQGIEAGELREACIVAAAALQKVEDLLDDIPEDDFDD